MGNGEETHCPLPSARNPNEWSFFPRCVRRHILIDNSHRRLRDLDGPLAYRIIVVMTAFAKTSLTRLRTIVSGRRRFVRHPQDLLLSSLGQILDISLGGARVITRLPRSGIIQCKLYGVEGEIPVECRVARCQRRALFRYEIGLEFLNVSESLMKKLTRLSTDYRVREELFPQNL